MISPANSGQAGWRILAAAALLTACLLLSAVHFGGTVGAQTPPAGAVVRLEPSFPSADVGQSLSVALLADNVSDLYGVEIRLRFDPRVLQVRDTDLDRAGVQILPGYFPDGPSKMVFMNRADNEQGIVDYVALLLAPSAPVSGSGTVATVDFVATADGSSALHFETAKMSNRGVPIPVTAQDGRIQVGPTTTPATSPGTTPPTATSIPSATATASATATPFPVPAATPSATPTIGPGAPTGLARTTWYFAEGSTRAPFDTWLLLQNPGGQPAPVRILFMRANGAVTEVQTELLPTSRRSFYVNQIVPDAEVSMVVQSESLVLAERAMYFGTDGHASAGIPAPSNRWYLAEGSTEPPFQTWILVQNPGGVAATVSVRYMLSDGSVATQRMAVAPFSRASIYANLVLPAAAFSAEVVSDQPIVVERAMYLESGGGHGSPGVAEPSRTWYLAEGSTEEGFDTWILLQNPGREPVPVTLTAMKPDGTTARFHYLLSPTSRTSVYANLILPPTQFGARVDAGAPIIVERAMYFGAPARGAHDSVASPAAATAWYLPEGSTADPFHEYLLLLNPQDHRVVARVNFMKEDGFGLTREFPLLPTSRLTIDVNREVPGAAVSAKVLSDAPIVVERSLYFEGGQGGTNTVGIARR